MEEVVPRREITIAEKKMVVKCYQFFELEKAAGNYRGSRTREIVLQCIGVKPATVARVWEDYKRDPQHFLEACDGDYFP
ncbi:hypothetical protein DVH05_024071 [Phytophthora capsici]|nr:hypothetical protein DVH05_024071 [Phytophthora capsici]|eukprot:jgi/Phyca11/125078/e_gw1.57.305.1